MTNKCRFLIVDDNHIDRMVAAMVLQQSFPQPSIKEAVTGLDALNWLLDNEEQIDENLIILLDIRMPEMDGFEFLEEYDKLQKEWKKKVQIVMLSSTVDPRDVQRANENKHVKALLSKPLPFDELCKAVSL